MIQQIIKMKIICDKCDKELESPGALLFSPPQDHHTSYCVKLHLCVKCYNKLMGLWFFKHE